MRPATARLAPPEPRATPISAPREKRGARARGGAARPPPLWVLRRGAPRSSWLEPTRCLRVLWATRCDAAAQTRAARSRGRGGRGARGEEGGSVGRASRCYSSHPSRSRPRRQPCRVGRHDGRRCGVGRHRRVRGPSRSARRTKGRRRSPRPSPSRLPAVRPHRRSGRPNRNDEHRDEESDE